MNINLFIEIILVLFAILFSNGIIYSLIFFNLKRKNSSENISAITNNSETDGLALTLLIASNPINLISSDSSASNSINLTSSDSSASETLSVISSNSSASETLSVTSSDTLVSENLSFTSSETNVSQDIFDSENWIDSEIGEGMVTHTDNPYLSTIQEGMMNHTENPYLSSIYEGIWPTTNMFGNITSLDSLTILNSQQYEQWREIATSFYELPINTPAGILQTMKVEELKILYSQDMIQYAITQTELRLIIEHFPAMSLFSPDFNHLILTMMTYYHL